MTLTLTSNRNSTCRKRSTAAILGWGLRIDPYFVHALSDKTKPSQGRRILLAMQVELELKKGEETFFALLQH